ncbi:PREDICTED: heat shock protein beta-7-like [Nanorana parkeri]|uniref:heat shock protein beta-7-like n=1 Tax=Nanorana parkeri TaxID=125878 RepID=UPI000854C3A7|nr:PREDICTED: heat shock protein beta-7-like [Nanorana parkeri]
MNLQSSTAFRSEHSFKKSSSSSSVGGVQNREPFMDKTPGIFSEDFGKFRRPLGEPLGFSGKLGPPAGRLSLFTPISLQFPHFWIPPAPPHKKPGIPTFPVWQRSMT